MERAVCRLGIRNRGIDLRVMLPSLHPSALF